MKRGNFPRRKDEKRADAKVRQAASDALTPEQKLAKLDAAGLVAKKERAKLAKLLSKS